MANVVITGTGCITGSGGNAKETLAAMYNNTASPAPFQRNTMEWGKEALVFAADHELNDSSTVRASRYGLSTRFGLAATFQALEDAGLSPKDLPAHRVGVVMGTTVGCSMNSIPFYEAFREHTRNDQPKPNMEPIRRFLRSNPAEAISYELKTSGPTQSVVNACASGTDAIGIGLQWIESGMCDVVIAGGCDALTRVTLNGFNSLMVMANAHCRPFDAERTGLNLGEGAGIVILESKQHTVARSAKIQAKLSGYASACDAHHLTAPHPEGQGLIRAMLELFAHTELNAEDISFVNVHGTATKDNDAVEGHVMSKLLPETPFFSSKGATGHTLGAAGAIEAALCVHCLQEGRIPPTTGLVTPDPTIAVKATTETTAVRKTTALSTSLAFGGLASVLAITHP